VPEDPQGIVVVLLAVLTQLGDAWFLFSLLALIYWLGEGHIEDDPRRTAAVLVALGVGGTALLVGLKAAFGFARPPGAPEAVPPTWLPAVLDPAFIWAATADGLSFPSGHALGSTVVYGGMAALLDVWDRRRRALVAGTLVAVVAATRVGLGVHYLTDVLAGIAIGLVFLALALRVVADDPVRAFALAAALGVFAVVAALATRRPDSAADAASTLGAGVGGLLAWHWFRAGSASRALRRIEAGVGLLFAGGLWILVYSADLSLPATVGANAVALAAIVALPEVFGRLWE
jgi:membrane-associated phospholipid phosphatase